MTETNGANGFTPPKPHELNQDPDRVLFACALPFPFTQFFVV